MVIRIAVVCPVKECGWRQFGDPKALCPTHHRAEIQTNRSYFGRPTPQPTKGK